MRSIKNLLNFTQKKMIFFCFSVFHSEEDSDHIFPQQTYDEELYDDDDYETINEKEFDDSMPYGIQNVRDVKEVQTRRTKLSSKGKVSDFFFNFKISFQFHLNNLSFSTQLTQLTFQSLCPAQRHTVHLNRDSVYEYRPDHYEEVSCLSPYHHDLKNHRNKVCGEAGFSCLQLNRTIFLTRRAHGADCWESETRLVLAGCECMWPKHNLGDIAAHH